MKTTETAPTRAFVEQAVASLVQAHSAARAAVSGEIRREEWQLRSHVKGEADRWLELHVRYDYDPSLYFLSEICVAHEALLLALAAYDELPPAATKPPPLGKMRHMGAGSLRGKP